MHYSFPLKKLTGVLFITLISGLLLSGCLEDLERTPETPEDACDGLSAEQVKATNGDDISYECRKAVLNALDNDEQHDLQQIIRVVSKPKKAAKQIYLAGLIEDEKTEQQQVLTLELLNRAKFVAKGATLSKTFTAQELHLEAVDDSDEPNVQYDVLLDYSASLLNNDFDKAGTVMQEFVDNMPANALGRVNYFSNISTEAQELSDDSTLISSAFIRDKSVENKQTALYDALAGRYTELAEDEDDLEVPVKIVIVYSDGVDDVSSKQTFASLQALQAKNKEIVTIIVGSFLANDKNVQALASEGLFSYTPKIDDLASQNSAFLQSLASLNKLTLPDGFSDSYTRLEISVDDIEFSVDLTRYKVL